MQLYVYVWSCLDEDDVRTFLACLTNRCSGLDTERLRLPAGCDDTRMRRVQRHHCNRPSLQRRIELLLGAGKETVEVQIQLFRMGRFTHVHKVLS